MIVIPPRRSAVSAGPTDGPVGARSTPSIRLQGIVSRHMRNGCTTAGVNFLERKVFGQITRDLQIEILNPIL